MLSIPIRLSVVVAAASMFVVLALMLIGRRRQSRVLGASALVEDSPLASSKTNGTAQIDDLDFDEDSHRSNAVQIQILTELAEISRISDNLSKTSRSPDIRQNGRKILGAAENARRLIQNESLLKHPEHAPKFKPLIVNFPVFVSTLAKKWAFIIRSEQVTFTCHLDEHIPPSLYVDPEILTRVLDSLLSNSQALTEKGRIHMHITGKEISKFNWDLNIIIADTGHGIRQSFKERFRNNDVQSHPEGPEELNIVAVRDLSRKINGEVDIKSVEGRGTEVTIKLKVRSAMDVHSTDVVETNGILMGKRVLIIEDDISSQEVLETFLRPEGCAIDSILDGDKAMETLEAKTYDLILMDVRMDGMDGIKTTQMIRNSGKPFSKVPIIAVTADVNPDTNAKCMVAGANLFLNKPIGAKALFNGIQFVMDLESADAQKTAAE